MKKLMLMIGVILLMTSPAWSSSIKYSVTGIANSEFGDPGTATGNIWFNNMPTKVISPDPSSSENGYGNFHYETFSWNLKLKRSGETRVYSGTKGDMDLWFTPYGDYTGASSGNPDFLTLSFRNAIFPFEVITLPSNFNFSNFQNGIFPQQIIAEGMPFIVDGFYPTLYLNKNAPVPEPSTMLLLCTGLVGLAGASFRKKI